MSKKEKANAAAFEKFVKRESRICFGIRWYADEATAEAASQYVISKGYTYNGGLYHGLQCGREPVWDHVDRESGKKLYGVTW